MALSRRSFLTTAVVASTMIRTTASARQATPDTTGDATARLNSMLQYVPGGKLDGEIFVVWNDYATQVAAIQENKPDESSNVSRDDLAMMGVYVSVPDIAMYATMLPELVGYSFGDINQALTFGTPPNTGLIVEVQTDEEALIEFWESMGYEERDNEHGSFWTIGEEAEINITNDIQRSLMARVNNVAILADGVLAYTSTSALLGEIQAVAAGDKPNVHAELETVTGALPADTTSIMILGGEAMALEAALATVMLAPDQAVALDEKITASDDAVGPMPVTRTVCIGATAGGSLDENLHSADAQEFALLELDGAGQAGQAADVITWRAENMNSLLTDEPYSQIVPELEVEALTDGMVMCTSPMENSGSVFAKMVMSRDILLFVY